MAHRFHHLWIASLAGCASAPRPLCPASVTATFHYVAIAPPRPAALSTEPKSVSVAIFALRTAPVGDSIEPALAAITAARGSPFRTASALPPGTLWLSPEQAADWQRNMAGPGQTSNPDGQVVQLCEATGVVLPDAETLFTTSTPILPDLMFEAADGRARLHVLAKVAGERFPQRLVLRDPLPDQAARLLFVASGDGAIAGYAMVIANTNSVDPAEAAAAAAAASVGAPAPGASAAERQRQLSSAAVGEHDRRGALLAIAQQLHLPRCIDLLLVADERRLIAMGTGTARAAPDDPGYPWNFERAVLSALTSDLQRDDLTPGLRAALRRHLGAVGSDAVTLQLLLATKGGQDEFTAAVQAENLTALDDRDVVQRVAAHDWLARRGAAVPGFDPLANQEERRLALRHRAEALDAERGQGIQEARK